MFILVFMLYGMFYNTAFSGYEPQGGHIWLSGSTVKFVNNWLKEGPINLHFLMLEYPDSVEFNSIYEREPYISYPPGAILPPYLLAKVLHKSYIQVGFIKKFLKIKSFLDALLVCFIFFGILTYSLKLKRGFFYEVRILLVAYKGDYDKDDEIIKKETHLINGSEPVFESENYAVYDITIFL